MKIYSIDEQTHEVLLHTLRDCDWLDNVTPSLPKFSVIADKNLTHKEQKAHVVFGEPQEFKTKKDDIEITVVAYLASTNTKQIDDYRKATVYNIKTKQREDVKYLGELKDEHTLLAPPSHNHEFIDGAWIITDEKKAELEREEKEREINELESQKQKLIGEMQMHQLLDEIDEAKAIALRVKEINTKIAELEK